MTFCRFLIGCLSFFLLGSFVEAYAETVFVKPRASIANVRSKPVDGDVLAKIKKGTKLKVIGRTSSTDIGGKKLWFYVETDQGPGWIASWILEAKAEVVREGDGGMPASLEGSDSGDSYDDFDLEVPTIPPPSDAVSEGVLLFETPAEGTEDVPYEQ